MKISVIDSCHPDYDATELLVNRALYRGGKYVRAIIEQLLHKGADEPARRYEARKKRAYYVNHCAGVIDQMVAWLFSAQPTVRSDPEELDPFWKDFLGNADREAHSLHQFQAGRFREAFITGKGWSLCELPDNSKVKATSLADEDAVGARSAYLVALPTEAVIDWEYDESGALLWAVVKDVKCPRDDPSKERGLKVFTWTAYTATGWTRYTWTQKKPNDTWSKNTNVDSEVEGKHSFGCVPLEELCLPDGFYILGKTQDHLVESYNARCAKSWGMYTGLFAMPVHKKVQGVEDASDTNIRSARLGAGYGIEIGEKEDLYLLEPTGASFSVATEHIAELKDELYRVVHQMALSADNSAGAMKRSGDSKAQDSESSEIVLQALSEVDAPSRERKLAMISAARGEEVEWDVTPVAKFSLQSSDDILQEGLIAGSAGIKSPTFEKERQKKMVRAVLPDLKEETAKAIEAEIEDGVDADPYGMAEMTGGLGPLPGGGDDSGAGAAAPAPKPRAKGQADAQARMNGYRGGMPQRRPSSQSRGPG